jgi:hypothetical protein
MQPASQQSCSLTQPFCMSSGVRTSHHSRRKSERCVLYNKVTEIASCRTLQGVCPCSSGGCKVCIDHLPQLSAHRFPFPVGYWHSMSYKVKDLSGQCGQSTYCRDVLCRAASRIMRLCPWDSHSLKRENTREVNPLQSSRADSDSSLSPLEPTRRPSGHRCRSTDVSLAP